MKRAPARTGRSRLSVAALAVAALLAGGPALGQAGARLPVAEGLWVDTGTACSTATQAYVHRGNRFGHVYFYGPNRSMGPSLEVEEVSHVSAGRDGFTVVNDGPIEVAAGRDRQMIVRAFSRAEGEVWRETLRLCALESFSPRMRAALAPYAAAEAREPPPDPTGDGPRWQTARVAEGGLGAYVAGPPAVPVTVLRCEGGTAVLHLNLAGLSATTAQAVEFVGSASGRRAGLTVSRNRQTGHWSAAAGAEVIGLLAGADPSAELRIAGRTLASLSLAGSSAAIGQALSGCPSPATSAAAPATAVPAAAAAPPLGLVPGHYVQEGSPCSRPEGGVFYYDGRRWGLIYPETGLAALAPVGRPVRTGAGWEMEDGLVVEMLSPTRMRWTYEETAPPMRLCPSAQIPADLRVP